jgi:hypothetical protein
MATLYRADGWVKTVQGQAIAGAQVYICLQPADISYVPPVPLASIFADQAGATPITQPIFTDGFGHYDYYAASGIPYTEVIVNNGSVQIFYPDQIPMGATLGSPSGNITSVFGRTGDILALSGDYSAFYDPLGAAAAAVVGLAPLASPGFTGVPTAPTAPLATNTDQIATTAFVLANAPSGAAGIPSPDVARVAIWEQTTPASSLSIIPFFDSISSSTSSAHDDYVPPSATNGPLGTLSSYGGGFGNNGGYFQGKPTFYTGVNTTIKGVFSFGFNASPAGGAYWSGLSTVDGQPGSNAVLVGVNFSSGSGTAEILFRVITASTPNDVHTGIFVSNAGANYIISATGRYAYSITIVGGTATLTINSLTFSQSAPSAIMALFWQIAGNVAPGGNICGGFEYLMAQSATF